MSMEVDLLVQEAKESIEAAQNYRSELQQRLHGLNQARKQVPASVPPGATQPSSLHLTALLYFYFYPPPPKSKQCCYFLFLQANGKMEEVQRVINENKSQRCQRCLYFLLYVCLTRLSCSVSVFPTAEMIHDQIKGVLERALSVTHTRTDRVCFLSEGHLVPLELSKHCLLIVLVGLLSENIKILILGRLCGADSCQEGLP